jgi:hypothetical protein
MTRSKRAGKALIASEARLALARLACTGAYAVPSDPLQKYADRWHILSTQRSQSGPALQVSRLAIEHCLRKGWLKRDKTRTDKRLCISAAGLREMQAERKAASRARSGRGTLSPASSHQDGQAGVLAWLRRRREKGGRAVFTEVQFNAAERLAADFWNAQMMPRTTANWSAMAPSQRTRRSAPGAGVEMAEWVVAARVRVTKALDAVGPELAGILVDVCCFDKRLEVVGQAAGWPERSARVVMDLALTRLARHSGMLPPERPVASRLRHWGDAGYRPNLDEWH